MSYDHLIKEIEAKHTELIKTIFTVEVVPVLGKNKWSMDWAMGSVEFTNDQGELVEDKTTENLETRINDIYRDLPAFGKDVNDGMALWWMMCFFGCSGRYSIEKGFQPYD
jgi:hypothetical protein